MAIAFENERPHEHPPTVVESELHNVVVSKGAFTLPEEKDQTAMQRLLVWALRYHVSCKRSSLLELRGGFIYRDCGAA